MGLPKAIKTSVVEVTIQEDSGAGHKGLEPGDLGHTKYSKREVIGGGALQTPNNTI